MQRISQKWIALQCVGLFSCPQTSLYFLASFFSLPCIFISSWDIYECTRTSQFLARVLSLLALEFGWIIVFLTTSSVPQDMPLPFICIVFHFDEMQINWKLCQELLSWGNWEMSTSTVNCVCIFNHSLINWLIFFIPLSLFLEKPQNINLFCLTYGQLFILRISRNRRNNPQYWVGGRWGLLLIIH